MALGSSAPEILLSVIETVTNLESCPGELGASTIVGSAAFNLLVISAVSIYAVNEKNDTDPERDDTVPLGVKKIYDLGVFSITATSSVFAYLWLFICLRDQMVEVWEGLLTFIFFFLLIGFSYSADKYKANQVAKEKNLLDGEGEGDNAISTIEFSALEIFRELVKEKQGDKAQSEEQAAQRNKMRQFIKDNLQTDQIDRVNMDELKKAVEGEGLISRIQYRKQVGNVLSGKRPVIAKGEVMKTENAHADHIDESLKNENFGFKCLHYSVSEASGHIRILVLNKKGVAGSVRVKTQDAEAIAGNDYEAVDMVLEFKHGEKQKDFEVTINDDDNWEPDEDFFVQMYQTDGVTELEGQDTRTRVTIIDDDKPGQISFEEQKQIKALATEEEAKIVILRKNGSDGTVKVDWETVQLDTSDHTATPGLDYVEEKGTLQFDHGETEKTICIKILQRPDQDSRDESFGIQLSNISPQGAKLSKKSFQIVNIITDVETKKKTEALAQLLRKIEDEESTTWGSQFITACMLHPTKNEDGEISDIEGMDGVLHLINIGWKVLFAFVPPPHMAGGWACFFSSLAMIGGVTYVVGEYANLFGCVLGIKPSITAITFVALGTSLPDTFASMQAAAAEKYADSAVGNVTGSNSVNVFLGLGLPWVIATIYFSATGETELTKKYYVPASSLGFSVVVFCVVAVVCIISLVIRRIKVGGELGGQAAGRTFSLVFLVSLWFVYIILSILQAYKIIPEDIRFGIQDSGHPTAIQCGFEKAPAPVATP